MLKCSLLKLWLMASPSYLLKRQSRQSPRAVVASGAREAPGRDSTPSILVASTGRITRAGPCHPSEGWKRLLARCVHCVRHQRTISPLTVCLVPGVFCAVAHRMACMLPSSKVFRAACRTCPPGFRDPALNLHPTREYLPRPIANRSAPKVSTTRRLKW